MDIHAGKMVREVFITSGMSVSELGRRVPTSRQNVYRIFERKSIDSDLLQRLGKALSHDFFPHFSETPSAQPMGGYAKSSHTGKENALLYKEVESMRKELADVNEKFEMVKRINELLEKEVGK